MLAEFLEFEKDQIQLGENAVVVSVPRVDGTPAIGMPYRKQTFTGSKHMFQGRLYRGGGPKYWGTQLQNVTEDTVPGDACNDRYTYLIFTNLDSSNSTGKVTLTVVEKEKVAASLSMVLVMNASVLLSLLIFLN